jgi:RNA polymerase sigma factor (sigma-70 family)
MHRDSGRIYDEYLVSCAVTGDRDALARLVERWQPRLLRHAWRVLGDVEPARDAVQEGWIEILRGLRRLDDVVAFPAWAYRIVTRRCQRRFQGDPLDYSDQPPDHAATSASGQPADEIAAEMGNVLAAMARLPNAQRAALALFHAEDLSVAEIAIALDVPPGTVKTRLMHARRKLRAFLGEDDGQDG